MHPSLPDLIGRESLWEGDVDSEAASESGGNVLNRLDSMGLRSGNHESRRRELDGKGGRGIVYWLKLLDLLYRKETHFSLLYGAGCDAEKVSPMVDVFIECLGRPISPGEVFFLAISARRCFSLRRGWWAHWRESQPTTGEADWFSSWRVAREGVDVNTGTRPVTLAACLFSATFPQPPTLQLHTSPSP